MTDPFDEDADVRSHLAVLGPAALAELRGILEAPSTYRTAVLRRLMARPARRGPRHVDRDGRRRRGRSGCGCSGRSGTSASDEAGRYSIPYQSRQRTGWTGKRRDAPRPIRAGQTRFGRIVAGGGICSNQTVNP